MGLLSSALGPEGDTDNRNKRKRDDGTSSKSKPADSNAASLQASKILSEAGFGFDFGDVKARGGAGITKLVYPSGTVCNLSHSLGLELKNLDRVHL